MLLDKTQNRQAVARRVLLLALIPGTAALVGLAMLRPTAQAKTRPQIATYTRTSVVPFVSPPDPRLAPLLVLPPVVAAATPALAVTLVGVTDGVKWWSPSGTPLAAPLYDVRAFHSGQYDYWRKAMDTN